MSMDTMTTLGTRSGFSKSALKKCNYDNLLRLAIFMGVMKPGDHPSPGYLAYMVSKAMKRG